MDLFLHKLFKLQLGRTDDPDFRQIFKLEQIKTVDSDGYLLTAFPTRFDLIWIKISKEIIFTKT